MAIMVFGVLFATIILSYIVCIRRKTKGWKRILVAICVSSMVSFVSGGGTRDMFWVIVIIMTILYSLIFSLFLEILINIYNYRQDVSEKAD